MVNSFKIILGQILLFFKVLNMYTYTYEDSATRFSILFCLKDSIWATYEQTKTILPTFSFSRRYYCMYITKFEFVCLCSQRLCEQAILACQIVKLLLLDMLTNPRAFLFCDRSPISMSAKSFLCERIVNDYADTVQK